MPLTTRVVKKPTRLAAPSKLAQQFLPSMVVLKIYIRQATNRGRILKQNDFMGKEFV